jgi:antitoxin ParD1/3/4
MPSINISLSDELKRYVESQIRDGQYGNVSEYFRSLIRDHQKRATEERLESLLLAGMESGSAGPMTKPDWAELRKLALDRVQKRSARTVGRKKSARYNVAG